VVFSFLFDFSFFIVTGVLASESPAGSPAQAVEERDRVGTRPGRR